MTSHWLESATVVLVVERNEKVVGMETLSVDGSTFPAFLAKAKGVLLLFTLW